jgi:hypothetical protein
MRALTNTIGALVLAVLIALSGFNAYSRHEDTTMKAATADNIKRLAPHYPRRLHKRGVHRDLY